jgi:hypothetical protein
MNVRRLGLVVTMLAALAGLAEACGSGRDDGVPGSDGGPSNGDATATFGDDGATGGPGPDVNGPILLTPANSTIDVNYGQPGNAVVFSATIHGIKVPASFAIDRGELGPIAASTGVFTPDAIVGGTANVSATYGTQQATTTITVRIHFIQNGAAADAGASDASAGSGGNGGVGGEGPGGPVDASTQTSLLGGLDGGAVAGAALLYPYDRTVWPRGLLAPLLQWSAPQDADAVLIHLSENAFDYEGFFAATATPFVHHPIPQAAWDALCNSNQGEDAHVTLVFSSAGQATGPLAETWTIAQGTLAGTVYYNSYGTNAAHLADQQTYNGGTFGAATLAIKHAATAPVLVAGNDTECRVCHVVSADGSRLVTSVGGGGDQQSAWYDLKNGYAETLMSPADGRFNWGALSPDGTLLLNNGAMDNGTLSLPGSAAENGGPLTAQLFAVATGASVASTGLPASLVAGSPVFSPDGTHVAFNFYSGTATAGDGGAVVGDGVSIAAMDYDPASNIFSNFRVIYTPSSGTAVWPSFAPTNDAIVFELETQSNGRDWGGTRSACDSTACLDDSASGTKAELWWVSLTPPYLAARFEQLNGSGYLPTLPATDHTDDAHLNYEPTLNPVPSGGYAWVVFTSRRLYGNVATVKPYWSDPRYRDISTLPTTKKLWVGAVDLKGTPGTDTSHPAFYLPAQELLAGNSRGFWVVDPCENNGATCQTGDQCCGGYCENMTCSDRPPACSSLNDKCGVSSDCCGLAQGATCIDGRCAEPTPPAVGSSPPK